MGLTTEILETRFHENVTIVPFSTCHYWTGRLNDSGYGVMSVKGREVRAHRLSYELAAGAIPEIDGKTAVIRHKCDQPLCVNPDHLIPGTQADNVRDAAERKRMPRGERHPACRVSEDLLAEIAEAISSGGGTSELANRFGVSPSFISTLRHGRGRSVGVKKPTGRSDRQISDEKAIEIYRMAHNGNRTWAEIAELYGVSRTMVSDIKRGATYASVTGHRR